MSGRIYAPAIAIWLALFSFPIQAEEPRPTTAIEKPSAAQVAQWRKQLLELEEGVLLRHGSEGPGAVGRRPPARVAAIDDPGRGAGDRRPAGNREARPVPPGASFSR